MFRHIPSVMPLASAILLLLNGVTHATPPLPKQPAPPLPEVDASDNHGLDASPASARLGTRNATDGHACCTNCGCASSGEHGCCKACTCKEKKAASAKAVNAYKGVYYANDFSYLCDPCYGDCLLGDQLKRLAVGDCWTVDVGGEYRMRFHSEQNIRNSGAVVNNLGLTGNDDDFLLHRTRLFVNAEYGSHFRFYGEMLDAVSEFETNPVTRPIEENRADMQNLFAEVRGVEVGGGKLTARIGRQEILLGNQRLVSPLDWANTRRTFEGGRVIWQGDNWDLDGFWLRPMKRDAAHREKLDAPNLDRQMYGVYGTYKGLCRDHLEAYWLALDYEDVGPSGFRYDTLGARY